MKTENIIIIAAHPTSHRLTHTQTHTQSHILFISHHHVTSHCMVSVFFVDRSLQLCFALVWN